MSRNPEQSRGLRDRAEKGIKTVRNIGRGIDGGTILATGTVTALAPLHPAAVSFALLGEVFFENLKLGYNWVTKELPKSFRAQSSRESQTAPMAA